MKFSRSNYNLQSSYSEPPLNEEDVPPGEWLCPRCRALQDIRALIDSRKNSNIIKNTVKQVRNGKGKLSDISETWSKSMNLKHKSSPYESSVDSHKIRLLDSLTSRKNPFADLARISLLINPREYELPEDYVPDIQFPGSSKTNPTNTATREARLTSYSVRRAQELDRNSLPLILRTCYFCRRGCRKAPLIHCDYCPLVYHADCIDPPLTTLPNTRWMCPNHVEPIAEEKLLSSSSFCERVRLWNHFSKPIDQESIKISFLDKVHRGSSLQPEDHYFLKLGCRVPKRVKRDYEKFIVDLEKYNGESEAEEEDELLPLGNNKTESATNVSLTQMIESGRMLETGDCHPCNGDVCSDNDRFCTSRKDLEEKREWLEFLQKLGNDSRSKAAARSSKDEREKDSSITSNVSNIDPSTIKWPSDNLFVNKLSAESLDDLDNAQKQTR